MLGLAFHHQRTNLYREYYAFLVSCFGITDSWEIGCDGTCDSNWNHPSNISTVAGLPTNKTLVVACHKNAKYLQGTIDLKNFVHPADCIYVFGDDNGNLDPDMFQGYTIQKVYVDVQYEMYSHQIAAMFMWDRVYKASQS